MTPERRQRVDEVLARRQPDLTVLAENLHKPRNFSAVVRTCESVGVADLHAVYEGSAPPQHWHTCQGAIKWVDVHAHAGIDAACEQLKKGGFRLVAAHLSDQAVDYRQVDFTKPTALVIGTELFGVSNETLRQADEEICIPMLGMSQSLNVSVACAIVLYEAVAQRQSAGMYDQPRLPAARLQHLRFEWLHPVVAEYCRERGLDYPALDENGDMLSDPRQT